MSDWEDQQSRIIDRAELLLTTYHNLGTREEYESVLAELRSILTDTGDLAHKRYVEKARADRAERALGIIEQYGAVSKFDPARVARAALKELPALPGKRTREPLTAEQQSIVDGFNTTTNDQVTRAFAERHVVGAHNLTECMEALDLAEAAHAAREGEAERLRALAHHLHEALAFMRSCELSGESGADHSTVISALEAYEGFEFDSERCCEAI